MQALKQHMARMNQLKLNPMKTNQWSLWRAAILSAWSLAALPAFAAPNPERDAYFGETHIHTSWSVDAWVMGNRVTGPADAYNYAKGQPIKHPMGFDIKIETPMDFMGVTDHSEYVGVTKQANTPGSYVSKLPAAKPLIMDDPNSKAEQNRVFSICSSSTPARR